jgi:hypothetical protein
MFTQMTFEQEFYENEYEKATNMKNSISTYNEDWIDCNLEDLQVGDIIYTDYIPNSQKHFYSYPPEYGTVDSIEEILNTDDKPQKILSIKIINHNGQNVELVKDNIFMTIKKYELNHSTTPCMSSYDDCYICGEEYEDCSSE